MILPLRSWPRLGAGTPGGAPRAAGSHLAAAARLAPRSAANPAAALLVVALVHGALPALAADRATVPLNVSLRARALAPGEPVRVVVTAQHPLASLTGTLLDQTLSLHPGQRSANAERWMGWALIELERAPGLGAVEVRGVTTDGRPAEGTLAFEIDAREFPVENLDVAPRYVDPPPEVQQRLEDERSLLAAIYRRREAIPHGTAGPWIRPVDGPPTSVFGTRRLFNGQPRSPHPGLDLRAAEGTVVRATGPGRVVLARDLYYSGNTVILDHGGGLFTLYAHLSHLSVAPDQRLQAGDPVGLSGATGRVTAPHLHWGAKIGDRPFDPTALLAERLWR